MKVVIETNLVTTLDEDYNKEVEKQFLDIIRTVAESEDEEELRKEMKNIKTYWFDYGYGSNHLWVHQIMPDSEIKNERIIFAEF